MPEPVRSAFMAAARRPRPDSSAARARPSPPSVLAGMAALMVPIDALRRRKQFAKRLPRACRWRRRCLGHFLCGGRRGGVAGVVGWHRLFHGGWVKWRETRSAGRLGVHPYTAQFRKAGPVCRTTCSGSQTCVIACCGFSSMTGGRSRGTMRSVTPSRQPRISLHRHVDRLGGRIDRSPR